MNLIRLDFIFELETEKFAAAIFSASLSLSLSIVHTTQIFSILFRTKKIYHKIFTTF